MKFIVLRHLVYNTVLSVVHHYDGFSRGFSMMLVKLLTSRMHCRGVDLVIGDTRPTEHVLITNEALKSKFAKLPTRGTIVFATATFLHRQVHDLAVMAHAIKRHMVYGSIARTCGRPNLDPLLSPKGKRRELHGLFMLAQMERALADLIWRIPH